MTQSGLGGRDNDYDTEAEGLGASPEFNRVGANEELWSGARETVGSRELLGEVGRVD